MVDRQHRPGAKAGSAGVADYQDANVERRERLRKLALETIDLSKDPYFMKNHIGTYECRLCLTLHTNEGSYLAHTQGKKHQTNLQRRQQREAKDSLGIMPHGQGQSGNAAANRLKNIKKKIIKIGRPGYRVVKQKDPDTQQKSLLFEIDYAEIDTSSHSSQAVVPKHRIMSAYEQKIEIPDKKYQYLLFAADPYETIAFKIPNLEIDTQEQKYYQNWNESKKVYSVQLFFKGESR